MANYHTKSLTITLYDGTKKRLKFRGKTEREAQKKLDEARLKYENGLLTCNSRTSFQAWAEEWKEAYAEPVLKSADYAQYASLLENYFFPQIGRIRLCDLRTIHLQRCANAFAGMSKSQISKARIVLCGVLQQAVANKLLHEDLTAHIKWPSGYEGERRALTAEERARFLRVLPQHPKGAMFAVMYYCGLRPGEVRSLGWRDIDFQKNELRVRAAVKKSSQEIGDPKSKSGFRIIPMPQELAHILRSLAKHNSVLVFPDETGKPWCERAMKRAWNSLLRLMYLDAGVRTYRNKIDALEAKMSGMSDLVPYCLRHTYATMLAEAGVDLKTAQYLLGHSTITMTAKYYTHVTPVMVENAREKIERIHSVPQVSRST